MYPSGDLKELAQRREFLQLQIELRRERCLDLGCQVEAKLEKWMKWGRILRAGLLGATSFGLLRRGRRSAAADFEEEAASSLGGHLLRWTPIAWRAVRLVTGW
jgi:hypothetical protein